MYNNINTKNIKKIKILQKYKNKIIKNKISDEIIPLTPTDKILINKVNTVGIKYLILLILMLKFL